ncbi:MAG TPA: GTP-binding protein [Bacteroidales bacterium]|nr:GTP-binding protein [Bacteroidales bacterium]
MKYVDIDQYNSRFADSGYLNMELLRFTTAGSVDDGKSTLIGRLLYDTKAIFEDQLEAVKRASLRRGSQQVDLSLFTDGLRAEREQGITIDVAYRYFATPKRKFIIADTPGHIEYTRNMVTGASTANAAIILIDARNGVTEQTHRHACIASLLQIPHLVICINKMDLVDYSETVYNSIKTHFNSFASRLKVRDIRFVPISALEGDNVVDSSPKMPWYNNNTLLEMLEQIPVGQDYNLSDARFPVQLVIRPKDNNLFHDYRAYAGRIASGEFHEGDKVLVLPTALQSTIIAIDTHDGRLRKALPPQSVSLQLSEDLDVSRGCMIVDAENPPTVAQDIEIMMCWMNQRPLVPDSRYLVRHTTRETKAIVKEVIYKLDVSTLDAICNGEPVKMNDIARVRLKTAAPLFYDSYVSNRITGALILIDERTNETVGVGMIV